MAAGESSDPWASNTTVTTATPVAWPICWTVFSTPAARPSSAGGAAFRPAAEGAGSAIEMPTPASTNGATKAAYDAWVCASCRIHRKPTACSTSPGAASARAPTRSTSRPATGATSSGVIVHGRKRSPVPRGESPREIWKNWLVTYAVAKIDAAIRNCVPAAAENTRERNKDSGTIGSGATDSQPRNAASRTTPRARATSTSAEPHPASGARRTPHTIEAIAPEAVTIPSGSRRVRGP